MTGQTMRSGLLAGFAAGFIYLFISVETGGGKGAALVALGFVLVVAVVTIIISTVIIRSRSTT